MTIGSPISRIKPAIAGVATSRPNCSIRTPLTGERTTPPNETPVEEMAIAQARRWTNQRARVALTATPALMPEPSAITM